MFAGCIETISGSDNAAASIGEKLALITELHGIAFSHTIKSEIPQSLSLTLKSTNSPIITDDNTGCVAIGWMRIDNRDEVAQATALKSRELSSNVTRNKQEPSNDTALVLNAYLHWGEELAQHLIGDFSFVIWNPRTQSCLLVRDQLGIRPLYFHQSQQRIIFSTNIGIFKELIENLDISSNWLKQFLANNSEHREQTVFTNIKKLPPAHIAIFKKGTLKKQRYFQFDTESQLSLSCDADYLSTYRERLGEAIRCRLPETAPNEALSNTIAIELSGGLDSSTIAAITTNFLKPKQQIQTYSSIIFEEDEHCIHSVIEYLAVNTGIATPFVTNPADIDLNKTQADLREIEKFYGAPIEQAISLTHCDFYRDAQTQGIKTLSSGFGGDEFVTNQASWVIDEYWQKQDYKNWFNSFQGNLATRSARKIKWLYRYFVKTKKTKNVNDMLVSENWTAKMTTRLENCSIVATKYGLEYSWPLLDIRLIQFFLSVPNNQKRGRRQKAGIGRYLHRQALEGELPKNILWKQKSMGQPISNRSHQVLKQFLNEQKQVINYPDLNPELQKVLSESEFKNLSEKATSTRKNWYPSASKLQRVYQLNRWLNTG